MSSLLLHLNYRGLDMIDISKGGKRELNIIRSITITSNSLSPHIQRDPGHKLHAFSNSGKDEHGPVHHLM